MPNKRGNGEGSISKRADGTWWARVTIGRDANGKQKRKAFYGKTRKEVQEKMTAALNEINTGSYIEPTSMTLGKWLTLWLDEYVVNSVKQSTRVSYDTFINKHINPVIGNINLQKLRPDIIQKFYNDKLESGRLDGKGDLNPKTIRNMHNMLHEALNQAVKNELIPRNFADAVTLPKTAKKEMRVLTPEEQTALIKVCNNENNGIFIILALSTGMRLGEILGLKWSDIDFKNKTLSVKRTVNRLKNYDDTSTAKTTIIIDTPKTKTSKRVIPLSNTTINYLKSYKSYQSAIKFSLGISAKDDSFVFMNSAGNAGEPKTYQELFNKLICQAEIEKANFHCLRHTFATRALEEGIPAKTVSEILGHANFSTTLDLYSHVLMDTKRNAMEKMSKFLEI